MQNPQMHIKQLAKAAKTRNHNNHSCCVPNCTSLTGRDPYRFFRVKRSDNELTFRWTVAINKRNNDGSLWHPSGNSRICGRHFKYLQPKFNTAYAIPTLFLPERPEGETPEEMVLPEPSFVKKEQLNLEVPKIEAKQLEAFTQTPTPGTKLPSLKVKTTSKGTQVWRSGNDQDLTVRVLSDTYKCKDFLGISLPIFNHVLQGVTSKFLTSRSLTKRDQLTIMFFRIKTGLPFTNIAMLFDVSEKTVSKVIGSLSEAISIVSKEKKIDLPTAEPQDEGNLFHYP